MHYLGKRKIIITAGFHMVAGTGISHFAPHLLMSDVE